MKIGLINQQKIKRVKLKQLHKFLKKVFVLLNIAPGGLSILLCDNTLIKKLNKKYFKKSGVTDVIAFPLTDDLEPNYLGEVIVSVEEADRSAKRLGCKWQDELRLYLIHGILHLVGYSDRTKLGKARMDKEQMRILKSVSK